MTTEWLWVVRTADNVFIRDKGGEAVGVNELVVTVTGDQAPDARHERYDASSPTGRRVATGPEIAGYDASLKDAVIQREAGLTMAKALILFYLRDKLGRDPTGPERQAARDAFFQAFRDVS